MHGKILAFYKNVNVPGIALLFLLTSSAQFASAIQVAKFAYKLAPENLNNRTLKVDGDMVAMSEEIYVQLASNSNDTLVDTPSVFFIIDNSGSMVNNPGTDRNGNRFTVTSALLDTLQKNSPNVEVGLSIFGSTLFFDPSDKPYFRTCPRQQGAYVPLLQLGRVYPAYGNMTGYAILKEVLAVNTNGTLRYIPSNNSAFGVTGTNITAGFDASRNAFKSSINVASHQKQFVIFLSDGMANVPDSNSNGAETFRFARGDSMPTTFTVFFSTANPPTVPSRIDTMTTNIRNNGWSVNNPKSDKWGYQNTTQSALMDFLMTNVITVIAVNSRTTPKSVTLGSATATNWVNGRFTFPLLFPLTGAMTPFNYSIIYSIYKNSVFIKDTVHTISNLNVQIDPATNLPADSFDVKHWDRNLDLRNNNVKVTTIIETMDSLELVLDYNPGTALYNYTNIKVQVYNQLGTSRDNEVYTLNKGTNLFSMKFKRIVSAAPIPGNKVFEHMGLSGDSLVAVFRNTENPALPLDTLRIAIPMNVTPLASLTAAITRDLDGNGFIDHIEVVFNKKLNLNNPFSSGFLVKGNAGVFHIDSIYKVNDSTCMLCLREIKTTLPQTSWTPDLSISFIPDVQPFVNFRTTDGCPPVVWEVKKYVVDNDRRHDTVKIFLSEKITNATGGPFGVTTLPSDVFHVWAAQGTSFALADTMFAGISGFTKIIGDSVLVLTMSNGKDLGTGNYINIRDNNLLRDKAGNFPPADNQRVRVTIVVGDIFTIITGPNPAHPALNHPEELKFEHNPNAVTWVRQGEGTIISLRDLSIPTDPNDAKNVKAYMKIMDVVGNPVNWCTTADMFATIPSTGGTAPAMNLYWNGLNNAGMMVAPGVYRVVVYIDYPGGSKISDARVISKIGIKH